MNSAPGSPGSPDKNEEAVQAIRFSENLDLVERIASGYMTSANAADHNDLRQEARLALHRASVAYRPEIGGLLFPQYAAAAIRNALIDSVRKKKRRGAREVMSVDAELSEAIGDDEALCIRDTFADLQASLPSLPLERAETKRLLTTAVSRLPERQRLLIQDVLNGRNLVQVAEREGVSKQATAKAYHLALAQLKQELHALGVKGLDVRDNVQFAEGDYSGYLFSRSAGASLDPDAQAAALAAIVERANQSEVESKTNVAISEKTPPPATKAGPVAETLRLVLKKVNDFSHNCAGWLFIAPLAAVVAQTWNS